MTNPIIDNDTNDTNTHNTNTNDTMDIDIFAPPDSSPEDPMSISLKQDLDVLRVHLSGAVETAPAEAASIEEVKDWCERWTNLTKSLARVITLIREHKVEAQLTDVERRHGHTGKEIFQRLDGQLTAMREAAAKKVAHEQLEAEKERLDEMDTGEGQKEKDAHDGEKDAHVEEKDAHDGEMEAHDEGKEAGPRKDEAAEEEEADAQEESPIERSARVYAGKKTSPQATSDTDVEIVEVVRKVAEPAVHKTSDTYDELNVIPCEKCVEFGIPCVRGEYNACKNCKHRKMACSLVPGKQKPSPPPNSPAPASTLQSASTSKTRPVTTMKPGAKVGRAPKPTTPASPPQQPSPSSKGSVSNIPRPGTATKAAPAPQAIVTNPKGKGKAADTPHQRVTPGPLGTQRAYVDLMSSRKRKASDVQEDSSKGESDAEDEDAYLAGRLNGLNTFVSLFETALGALKKEVTEIDGYLAQNRRRCRRRLH